MKSLERTLTLLLLAALSPLAAQPTEEPELLELSFSVFPLDLKNLSGILYAPEGDPLQEVVEIAFNKYERSPQYDYKGPPPLRFFREAPAGPDGEPRFRTVGGIRPGTGRLEHPMILFFERSEEGEDRYRVTHMMDNEESFPDDSLVFFNTMDITFKGVLGEQRLLIPPGASPPVSVTRYFEDAVPIAMAIDHDNKLHLVLRNKIRFFPNRRSLLILRKPRRSTSLRIQTQRLTEFTGKLPPDP